MVVVNKSLKVDDGNDGNDEGLQRIKWLVCCGIHHSDLVNLSQASVTHCWGWMSTFLLGAPNSYCFMGRLGVF
jgi:hypothetical protein